MLEPPAERFTIARAIVDWVESHHGDVDAPLKSPEVPRGLVGRTRFQCQLDVDEEGLDWWIEQGNAAMKAPWLNAAQKASIEVTLNSLRGRRKRLYGR